MYFLKNQITPLISSLNKNGIVVINSLIEKEYVVNKIKRKCFKFLNNSKYLDKSFNIKKALKKKIDLNTVTIHKKNLFLTKNELNTGYKKFSRLTNSIELIDPLLNLPELIEYIVSDEIINICSKHFKTNSPRLLYVAFRCYFKNNLPPSDVNYYHTDDRKFVTKSGENLLKLAIPFHLDKKDSGEYSQLIINKKKLKINKREFSKLQHSEARDFPKKFHKFLFQPNVKKRSGYVFDPNNFFHKASKPNKTRLICYAVYGKKTSYLSKKTKKIKITKKIFNNLNENAKKFTCLLTKT